MRLSHEQPSHQLNHRLGHRFFAGITALVSIVAGASPAFAQSERAYVDAVGGLAMTPGTRSGDVIGEAGVRIAPRLFVFGDIGQFHNLEPSVFQPSVDQTVATLSAAQGLATTGTARASALFSIGGLRYEPPMNSRVSPYVFGGVGVARLQPSAQFTYMSGPLAGVTPSAGQDVTSQLVSQGFFTQPAATTSFMFSMGGGVNVPVAPHLSLDAGYRYARVSADTPVNAQSVTLGFGYRF
jgi:hypothetical protein